MSRLSICLFGLPQFRMDETPIKVERRKTMAFVAYLACQPKNGCSRETLSALFWPDAAQEQAGAYMRQALWDFSKIAGEGWIERDGPLVRLRPEANIWVDVYHFEKHLEEWKAIQREDPGAKDQPPAIPLLQEAVKYYSADFMAGFTLRDCPAFDDWQRLQAEGLRIKLGEALASLSSLLRLEGRCEEGIPYALRWLALDELNEGAHRELMRLYDASEQRSAALRQFEICQRKLQEELGVTPEPETVQLFQQIGTSRPPSRGSLMDGATRSGPRPSPRSSMRSPLPVFLPAQSTVFLGRETELARIKEMLANPECRLVSLIGPGGSGKTRLAIQAAGQSVGYRHQLNFPHGIYFASLVNATNDQDILLSIASALKLEMRTEYGRGLSIESARAQLFNFLAQRKALIVLDNLEQLTENEAGNITYLGLLSELLSAAPELKLLATSRVRLNLPEEWVLEIYGLSYPKETRAMDSQEYASIQLFRKSAERASGIHPQDKDLEAVARICELVEGLPLGVELAAAWTKILSCQEIAEEIERNLDFLEAPRPGLLERHRSLRMVFEHSWQLLNQSERVVFRRLSIFRGGFTREAAYQVAGASLAMLSAFVDKSMLRRVSSGRFDLHELVKQYAAEKLAEAPDAQAETEAKQAQYYMDLLQQQGELLHGPEQYNALAALRTDLQNLRQAWSWLVIQRRYDRIEQILPDIILFNEMHGQFHTGYEMMAQLTIELRQEAQAGQIPPPGLFGLALAALRRFVQKQAPMEQVNEWQMESLQLAGQLPACPTRAYILLLNGIGAGILSPLDGIRILEQSAEIFQDCGNTWGNALAKLVMGDNLIFGKVDNDHAREAYQTSLAVFERLHNDWGRALCFFGLASVAWVAGQAEEASRFIQQSVDIYEKLGIIGRLVDARHFAGMIAQTTGRLEEARQLFSANLTYSNEVGDQERSQYYTEILSKNWS